MALRASPGSAPPALAAAPPVPAPPTLGGVLRQAAGDFYYNSWRLVPANLAWGALLLAILAMAGLWSSLALLALPVLGVAYAGMVRLAALIARGESVALGDAFATWRRCLGSGLGLGAGVLVAAAVLSFNVWYAAADGGVPAVAIGTASAWGLVALATFAVVAWPLLVDPARADAPVRARLRLAALLVLAHPGRMLGLAALVVVLLALSTVAFAALLTVSVAFSALVAARYVLPAADRLEARLAARGGGQG